MHRQDHASLLKQLAQLPHQANGLVQIVRKVLGGGWGRTIEKGPRDAHGDCERDRFALRRSRIALPHFAPGKGKVLCGKRNFRTEQEHCPTDVEPSQNKRHGAQCPEHRLIGCRPDLEVDVDRTRRREKHRRDSTAQSSRTHSHLRIGEEPVEEGKSNKEKEHWNLSESQSINLREGFVLAEPTHDPRTLQRRSKTHRNTGRHRSDH